MSKKKRRNISSPQAFASAFNRHQNIYKNPRDNKKTNLVSIKLIGQDEKGRLKEEKVYLPKWTVNSVQINFRYNRRTTLNLKELEERISKKKKKQPKKSKQQQK